jgi:TonB-dependent SusC/RagA subfamily outer membrane receptor
MALLNKIRSIGIILIIFLLLPGYDTPKDIQVDKIIKQLEFFRNHYRQQKVHLHTDKDVYMAPENIWIKSYLMEATTLLPDSISKEVFVDLIDFNNKHIRTIIIRNKNGYGQGNIPINDTLIEGNYKLRGYTNWMRNFDENYFFTKTITIKNPNYENVVTNRRLRDIKRLNNKRERRIQKLSLNFFPEGGYLVESFENKIAFKAENEFGQGLGVSGSIFEGKNKITDIETIHEGMGFFFLKPEPGKKYTCKVVYPNKKNKTFDIPKALPKGVVMTTDVSGNDKINITIRSNRDFSQNIASNEITVVAQSRNTILYVSKGEVKDAPMKVEIPKSIFPSGITQITLFDARNEPVCERLVFITPSVETHQNIIKLSETKSKDSTQYLVSITKPDGKPVSGNFSVSVRELSKGEKPSDRISILTNLLLTSDLKGNIENPWYYFSGSPDAEKNIDLVMLTHGWRRFVWKEILSSKFPKITCEPSFGVSIGGKITKDFFEIPVPDAKVRLTIKSAYNDVFETKADKKGRFMFSSLDYEDTVDILIEAFKPSGGKGVLIILGDTVVPNIVTNASPFVLKEDFPKNKIKANNKKERIEFKKNYKEREPDNQMFKIHQTPNDVIYVGDDVSGYTDIFQYMQGRVPGVNITGNKVIIRGISTLYGSTDPLFLLDGIPIDPSSVSMINPEDIAIIEILKGPEASIYGSRGANGVIAFYTKRGHFMKRGQINFGMLGYHKVREFYTPPYDSWNYKPQDYNVPRTLYWKPELITSDNGTASFKFKNSFGMIPTYITIEGLTKNGEIIWLEK